MDTDHLVILIIIKHTHGFSSTEDQSTINSIFFVVDTQIQNFSLFNLKSHMLLAPVPGFDIKKKKTKIFRLIFPENHQFQKWKY